MPSRVTHSLGRDGAGLIINLVQTGGAFVLQRQAGKDNVGVVSIALTTDQIRDLAAVAGAVR